MSDLTRELLELDDVLLARQSRGEGTTDLSRYRDDPIAFTRDVLRAEPTEQQRELMCAVVEHRRVALRAGFGLGKDWACAALMCWWTWCRGGKVYASATVQSQLTNVLATELRRHFERENAHAPGVLPGEVWRTHADVAGEPARVEFKTAASAEALRGRHDPRGVLAIISEASGVPEYAYRALKDCTVADDDRWLALGNPTVVDLANPFYRLWATPDAGGMAPVHLLRWSALDHPNVTLRQTVVPGAITYREVAERAHRPDGADYVCGVLGDFVPASELDALVSEDRLVALTTDAHRASLLPHGRHVVVGLDPAASTTGARFAAAVLRGGKLFDKVRLLPRERDPVDAVPHVTALLRSLGGCNRFDGATGDPALWGTRPVSLICDVIGVGVSVPRLLYDAGWTCEAFDGRGKVRQRRFENRVQPLANARAEAALLFAEGAREGRFALPADDPELLRELAALRLYVGAQGKLHLTAKPDLVAALGRSPDRADAVLMAHYLGAVGATIGGSPNASF